MSITNDITDRLRQFTEALEAAGGDLNKVAEQGYRVTKVKWRKGPIEWPCPSCNYLNTGPICTKCRKFPVCSTCGESATCFGTYEGIAGFGCDGCCGHGCEDGYCEMLSESPA